MSAPLARHVVCILHDDLDTLAGLVDGFPGWELDRDYSIAEPDPRMAGAFELAMDRVDPSMTDSDRQAIAAHRGVGYVLSPPLPPKLARDLAAISLSLVARAFDVGARAVKGESSGIAHGADRWRELARRSGDPEARDLALYRAWVRRPLGSGRVTYTCGMHLLGERDVEVLLEEPTDVGEALDWLDAFALYLLTEVGPDALQPGHTFRPWPDAIRRRLSVEPCTRYEPDDFFHNPHGYWRLA